jgi:RNA polymerase sigma-70 factor, ECF subfamily
MEGQPIEGHEAAAGAVDVAGAWHELGHRLRSYVSRRVVPADTDDIVQSVMVKLLERRSEIEAASVRAWLFTVTRNAVAEYYRQKRPTVELDAFGDVADTDPSDAAERTIGALADCLEPMLQALSESDADVLRKVDLEGQSQIELAAALGVPLSTLKSRVQRARTKLRATFDICCDFDLSHGGAPIGFDRRAGCRSQPCIGEDPARPDDCRSTPVHVRGEG